MASWHTLCRGGGRAVPSGFFHLRLRHLRIGVEALQGFALAAPLERLFVELLVVMALCAQLLIVTHISFFSLLLPVPPPDKAPAASSLCNAYIAFGTPRHGTACTRLYCYECLYFSQMQPVLRPGNPPGPSKPDTLCIA